MDGATYIFKIGNGVWVSVEEKYDGYSVEFIKMFLGPYLNNLRGVILYYSSNHQKDFMSQRCPARRKQTYALTKLEALWLKPS